MSTLAYPAPVRYRGTRRAPVEPSLHRPLLAALGVLVTLFTVSVSAGWRLATEVQVSQLAGDATAAVTDLVPTTGTVKVFVAAVIVAAFIRRNT